LAPRGNRARSYGDPQGRHFGFIEVADEEMAAFNFGDLKDFAPLRANALGPAAHVPRSAASPSVAIQQAHII
jgi:hypothetical protein